MNILPIDSRHNDEWPDPLLGSLRARRSLWGTFEQLTDRIQVALLSTSYPGTTKLPPERELADLMGVERSTLRRTVQLLTSDGFLEARRGRYGGTWIAPSAPPQPKQRDRADAHDALASYQQLEMLAIVGTLTTTCADCSGFLLTELNKAEDADSIRWADNRLRWHIWMHAGGVDFANVAAHMRLLSLERRTTPTSTMPAAISLRSNALTLLSPDREAAQIALSAYCQLLAS